MSDDSIPKLVVRGVEYTGLQELHVARALDHCAPMFRIAVSDRWMGGPSGWQVVPFDPVSVYIGNDVVLTGYVDEFQPEFDPRGHRVVITGRSKTADLVDCKPDIASGQFAGYGLAQIARALCGLFGIGVVVDPSVTDAVSDAVSDATLERGETAFAFLERLSRLAGVLLCDTPSGNLLLTRTGQTHGAGQIVEGQTIEFARARFSVHRRFSDYIVKGQTALTGGAAASGSAQPSDDAGAADAPAAGTAPLIGGTGVVQNAQQATAHDAGVPRYRPHVSIAESQLSQAQMQLRANWQRQYAFGRSIQVTVGVRGYRQPDASLWCINQMVTVTSPRLGLDQDLLVAGVAFTLAEGRGRVTELTLGPPEGYTPDPGEVKLRKTHKSGGRGHGHGHGRHGHRGGRGGSIMDVSGVAYVGN